MKYVGPARKKMGKKTIFNLIGPLSSPAKVKRQVVGVFDKKWMKPFAEALENGSSTHLLFILKMGWMRSLHLQKQMW